MSVRPLCVRTSQFISETSEQISMRCDTEFKSDQQEIVLTKTEKAKDDRNELNEEDGREGEKERVKGE